MRRRLIILSLVVIFLVAVLATKAEWRGTDDSVVAPMAQQAGIETSHLLPWSLDGDLELFVFCAGGAVAGFAAGYFWRQLFAGNGGGEPRDGGSQDAPREESGS